MTDCLIYRRFSTDEQEHGSGDTLTRQLDRCRAFAEAKGWNVTDILTDKGRSAFKGEHLLPDAELGMFVARVMAGEVQRGTVLVVERLDRLSRRPVDEAKSASLTSTHEAGSDDTPTQRLSPSPTYLT